jgi:5-methylcytosine-specific restriction endonuclease McrA
MNTALNQHVLVLNRLWQAVNVCTARRALTLLFQGQAQVVVNAEDGSFRTFNFEEWRIFPGTRRARNPSTTISFRIRVPRIILLLIYDRLPKKEVKFTRHNIFERDKNTCQYCGRVFDRKDLNLDHVIPRDRGGPTTWENIVCSCIECNTQKANRTPQEAGCTSSANPSGPSGGRSSRSTSACNGTTVGNISLTSPTGTSNWARTWISDFPEAPRPRPFSSPNGTGNP